ncbi:hypothetical protein F5884DRAFT_789224 [Xylogone sp. PMI_703]|nr:hypothetical protein F5884DRAFT_789224 [Xylogone sp. PMI_703]
MLVSEIVFTMPKRKDTSTMSPNKRPRGDSNAGKNSGERADKDQASKPDISIYEAATKSRAENEHLNSMVFHNNELYRARMRQIQATYRVKQNHLPDKGYASRIRLIWDHDRLWGTLEMGYFKGVFLVDPGPGQDHFKAEDDYCHEHPDDDQSESEDSTFEALESASESREYSLEWRGINSQMPDIIHYSTETVGKIRFGDGEIWGRFEAMRGIGVPCEFHGKRPFGPCIVSVSIQDVIDEWNEYDIFCDEELPRSSSLNTKESTKESTKDNSKLTTSSSQPVAAQPWTKEDQMYFRQSATGIFNITSKAVEGEWPDMSKDLIIRFHVDQQEGKVWGQFDVGIMDGYLLLNVSPNGLKPGIPNEFKWRGRDSGMGSASAGTGQVTISGDGDVQGIFHGVGPEIDFIGERNFMPGGISGYEASFYRQGWVEYAHGGNSDFYGRDERI